MGRQAGEVGLELPVPLGLDSDMGAVLGIGAPIPLTASRPVADGVPGVLDRHLADVLDDGPLLFKEGVPAGRGQDDEEPAMSKVAEVGLPLVLPPGPGPLGGLDRVSLQKLGVDRVRILAGRDRTGDEVTIPVGNVLNDLLDEAFDRSRFDRILPHHDLVMARCGDLFPGTSQVPEAHLRKIRLRPDERRACRTAGSNPPPKPLETTQRTSNDLAAEWPRIEGLLA